MKTIRYKNPKLFLLGCALSFTALAFATTEALTVPSAPAQPLCIEKQKTSCKISYLPPQNDGGSPITRYYIEYRDCINLNWKYIGTTTKEEYTIKNRFTGIYMQFRERTENQTGISKPSLPSSPTQLHDPY